MTAPKFNARFYLSGIDIHGEGIIFISFTFMGMRLRMSSGHRISPDKWVSDLEYQGCKRNTMNRVGVSATVINKDIYDLRAAVIDTYKSMCHAGVKITPMALRSAIHDSMSGVGGLWIAYNEYLSQVRVSNGRRVHLKSTMIIFKYFMATGQTDLIRVATDNNNTGKLRTTDGRSLDFIQSLSHSFNDVTHNVLRAFEIELCKTRGKNRVASVLKGVRAFFRWAKRTGKTDISPFDQYTIPPEVYGSPVCMSKHERDHLFNLNIESERLARVRDVFIFQCFIGCRISDLARFRKSNIIGGALEYIPSKSMEYKGAIVRVPLASTALTILARWDHLPGDNILPVISNAKYNLYLKELFRLASLNRLVTIIDTLTGKPQQVPLHQVACSHLARRTFINILHREIKNEVIASMTGHSKNSRAFSRYYNIEDDEKVEAINRVLE